MSGFLRYTLNYSNTEWFRCSELQYCDFLLCSKFCDLYYRAVIVASFSS